MLGRPFISTIKTKIDVQDGTFTIEFDEDVVRFNVYDAIKYLTNLSYVYGADVIDFLNKKYLDFCLGHELNIILCNRLNVDNLGALEEDYVTTKNLHEAN